MIRSESGKSVTWYDVEGPSNADIKALRKELNIHPLILDELIPQVRHPKLDIFGSHIFLVLIIPRLEINKETNTHTVRLEELDLIIAENWLVSAHYRQIDAIDVLFETLRGDKIAGSEYLSGNTTLLIYTILSNVLNQSINSLGRIEERLEKAELEVIEGAEKDVLKEVSELRRDIIDFRRALSPSRPVFRALDDAGPEILGKASYHYFRNLTGRNEQISTLLTSLKETAESLEEAGQTIITSRTNDIMRILTIFTAVMLPQTLIASILGMNMTFPFDTKDPMFFWWLIIIMGTTLAGLLLFLRKKQWL